MFKQKALHNPLRPVAPKLPSVKVNPVFYQNSTQLVFQDNNQTTDPLSLSKDGSDSAGSNGSSSDFETEMRNYKDSFMDPRYAAFKRNVTAMMSAQNQNKTTKSTSAQTLKQAPVFLKPLEAQRLKNSLLLADGGEEGYASGDVRYDPKTGKIVPRVKLETALPGVTGENSDAVDILADMPEDFNFTGWDNKTARQQQQELQKAGVTPKDQMVLLNSATSLETLALIQDISNNRRDYGLSVLDVERISKELLQISNARVGAKNHDIPLGVNPTTRNTFLAMLDEKQQSLLASFGFGVAGIKDSKNPNVDIGNKIPDLLQGDHSISDLLHGNSDAYQVADQFFGDMAKLDTMISNITDGTITFDNPKDKQRYLDYLTRAYEKNDNLYRNMLASEIEEAGLLQFPEWRLKQLVNDLSLTQLEGLVAQIEANGIKKLSRRGNFEKLMKVLLADKESASNLSADEKKSLICPYIFTGMDIVKEAGIQASGYFFEDGVYKCIISCPQEEPFVLEIGKKFPEEVAIDVRRTDAFNVQSEKLFKDATSPKGLLDIGFGVLTGMNTIPRFLPDPIGPSDVPYAGDALDRINWWNGSWNLTEDSILVSIYMHFPNDSIIAYDSVWFKRVK